MPSETGIDLHSGSGAIRVTTDGSQLLVNGVPVVPRQNGILGNAPVTNLPTRQITNVVSPNSVLAGRVPQVAFGTMSGVRFWYLQEALTEFAADNETIVEAAIEYPAGTRYPMTFQGNQWGILGRYGILQSDVAMVDIPAGATYYVITKLMAPNNTSNFNPANGYTTLAADVTLGASTITLTDLPKMLGNPTRLRIGGAGAEVVEIWKITGAASPYTAFIRGTLAANHTAAGSVVGQGVWASKLNYSDQITGGSSANTPQFDILTGTFTTPAASATTTIVADCFIGDTKIQVASANSSTQPGQVRTLDTAGSAETITIRTITGVANPFTAYLTAPLTKNHTSGASLAATISIDAVPAPYAVTADYYAGGTSPIILLGDSIALGTGNYFRTFESWATMPLDPNRPVLNIARSGESAQQFAANTNGFQRRRMFDMGKWLILAFGTNDLYGGRTLAQWQADTITICGWARARGMKIAIATITPRTTSTDGFETVANQTVVGSDQGRRVLANAWIRSGASGFADVVIELANAVEVNAAGALTQDGGFWKADTTTGPYTVDGLHPSYTGHQLLSRAVNGALFV